MDVDQQLPAEKKELTISAKCEKDEEDYMQMDSPGGTVRNFISVLSAAAAQYSQVSGA